MNTFFVHAAQINHPQLRRKVDCPKLLPKQLRKQHNIEIRHKFRVWREITCSCEGRRGVQRTQRKQRIQRIHRARMAHIAHIVHMSQMAHVPHTAHRASRRISKKVFDSRKVESSRVVSRKDHAWNARVQPSIYIYIYTRMVRGLTKQILDLGDLQDRL